MDGKPIYLVRPDVWGYSLLVVYPDGDYEFVDKFGSKRAAERERRRLEKEAKPS